MGAPPSPAETQGPGLPGQLCPTGRDLMSENLGPQQVLAGCPLLNHI